jgi:hypothetical protein
MNIAHERTDASPRVVALTAVVLAAGVAASLVISLALYRARYESEAAPRPLGRAAGFQHGPAARTSIAESWSEQDPAVRAHLDGYRWIDRDGGILQIPIDRAMELILAEQGEERR